jgi:hypothetical protein
VSRGTGDTPESATCDPLMKWLSGSAGWAMWHRPSWKNPCPPSCKSWKRMAELRVSTCRAVANPIAGCWLKKRNATVKRSDGTVRPEMHTLQLWPSLAVSCRRTPWELRSVTGIRPVLNHAQKGQSRFRLWAARRVISHGSYRALVASSLLSSLLKRSTRRRAADSFSSIGCRSS